MATTPRQRSAAASRCPVHPVGDHDAGTGNHRPSSGRARTPFLFGTKAQTLAQLSERLCSASVLPLDYFSESEWLGGRDAVLDRILSHPWSADVLIVRSSSCAEDTGEISNAGAYHSELGVEGRDELMSAIERVLDSYEDRRPDNQVLVQPQLRDVRASGVASSCEPSGGGPYRVVSWSDGADTTAATACTAPVRTWLCLAYRDSAPPSPALARIPAVLSEVEAVTRCRRFEMEFGVAAGGEVIVFQVRRMAGRHPRGTRRAHLRAVRSCEDELRSLMAERPPALGRETAFGVMPDWNPAEMIGIRPRPLALSLYRRLITDGVWAQARAGYGYRDVTGVQLMIDLCGLPYIDTRASFTSMVPADLGDAAATRLVEFYVKTLRESPCLHDKVEFDVALPSYDLTTASRAASLVDAGVLSRREAGELHDGLRRVTDRMLAQEGRYRRDLATVRRLACCTLAPPAGRYSRTSRITALLNLCRRRGTLPFAGLARAAFAAVAMVRSMVSTCVLSPADATALLGSASDVTATLRRDFRLLQREEFLKRHGYLRPGAYDILSPRYDEMADLYFDWSATRSATAAHAEFHPSASLLRDVQAALAPTGLAGDAAVLLAFIRESVWAREYAKLQFTRLLSEILVEIGRLGSELGFDREDMSCARIDTIERLSEGGSDATSQLRAAIEEGRARYALTQSLCAPTLLVDPAELSAFTALDDEPNFVTDQRVEARVVDAESGRSLHGAIAMVRSADPGYDWIFTHGVVGLITAFGGANSHMALRALELGIPAVIGAGELRFRRWLDAGTVEIDAACRVVRLSTLHAPMVRAVT